MNKKLFHLFKFFKNIFPHSFFARAFLIVVSPVILIQLSSGYVFFDRHWDAVTKVLAQNIAGNIQLVIFSLERAENHRQVVEIQRLAAQHLHLYVQTIDKDWGNLPWGQWVFRSYLKQALRQSLSYPFILSFDADWIHVWVKTEKGILAFKTLKKRLFSRTTPLFLLWSLGASLLFVVVAALFMRGQIRPLQRLAVLADELGKGRLFPEYQPSGATEIRKVGHAFRVMSGRLSRQLQQHTQMLAGISHDLRTPLTRMRLQLALMNPEKIQESDFSDLQEEVARMADMVEGYLSFAKGEETEGPSSFYLREKIEHIFKALPLKNFHVTLHVDPSIVLTARPVGFSRCLSNIFENALRYGKSKIFLSAIQHKRGIELLIDDDGPGIPDLYQEEVFRPFFRLEASRNTETGGVGLGLAVVRSFMQSHGGNVTLGTAPQGGLRVRLFFPT